VKLQIITLAAKLVVLDPAHPTLLLLARYSLALARYDPDYDVRDRARMLSALLRGVAPGMSDDGAEPDMSGVVLRREQVQLVLFEGKLAAKPDDMSTCQRAAARVRDDAHRRSQRRPRRTAGRSWARWAS
jgi:AP-3 complex subunit beta